MSRATLREQLAAGPLVVPGGGSPLEARLVDGAGFGAFYLSGYAVAAVAHGLPDIGITGGSDIVTAAARVTNATDIPVIVDADTGYGDLSNVRDTVRRLEQAGVAAIQIEDQVLPKRCGHMAGKRVIAADEMARKVEAALAARRSPETVIIARTDARAPLGLDEALARATRYAQLGADLTFVDAPESVEDLRLIGTQVPGPKVVNMSDSGKTPLLSVDEFVALGFDVVLYPTNLLRLMAAAGAAFLGDLRETGTSAGWMDRTATLDELNRIVGIDELATFEDGITGAESSSS
jgi:2,3-dimethylmalate lyase